MIARQWYGWTNKDNADAYEELIRTQGSNVNLVDGRATPTKQGDTSALH